AAVVALAIAVPLTAYAEGGKKNFKQGVNYEQNKQWDKAARAFALAIADSPGNIEYQLHYQRALVNSGIMLVEQGDTLAEQKDYNAAYQSYRQAFAFDPTNDLAVIKMRKMLEIQGLPTNDLPGQNPSSLRPQKRASNVKTSFGGGDGSQPARVPAYKVPRQILYRPGTSLQVAIENLAQAMNLNVLFDPTAQMTMRGQGQQFSLQLNDVTPARALELILLSNNLMYCQVDKRTIMVATDTAQSRQKYEPLAIRTFYLKNADANEASNIVKQTLAGGVGGTKQSITLSKQLNALIVRDTPANLELVEHILDSIDKSKAEVLVDFNIYEVSKDDLLKIGNQFNVDPGTPFRPISVNPTSSTDTSGTGGSQSSTTTGSILQDNRKTPGIGGLGGFGLIAALVAQNTRMLTGPWGLALGIPTSTMSFLQGQDKAKLLASTQVHVVDGEQHTIRIGQRVPIRTATLPFAGTSAGTTAAGQQASVGQPISTFGVDQIQYENVGLNIDMTPTVFDDEVQVKMKIESSGIGAGADTLTPTFTQRSLSSLARIKDGQTTMIAGVQQKTEHRGFKGLPLVGLMPILGRLFTVPAHDDNQSDVVITVTPHILRRADVREDDHLAYESGTGQNPSRQVSIEQILYLADLDDAQKSPVAKAAPAAESGGKLLATSPEQGQMRPVSTTAPISQAPAPGVVVNPPNSAGNFQPNTVQRRTVSAPGAAVPREIDDDDDDDDDDTALPGNVRPITARVVSTVPAAVKGTQFLATIMLQGSTQISYANLALSYDPTILEVKQVKSAGLMNNGGLNVEPQFTAQAGMLNIVMERPSGSGGVPANGQLVYIIFDVKGQGQTSLALGEHTVFRSPTGQTVPARFQAAQLEAR
ncbi:MAG TPA: secretin N-terminal domain-containing protein, partial [Blastocatellia bacterium]|nr:secretin N-terminal domain-containing protein [Blastocatellia bacterium]